MVSIRLTPQVIDRLCDQLLPDLVPRATHIQMSAVGHIVFGAYDWFEFGWLADELAGLLAFLESEGAISKPGRTPDEWLP